MVLPFAVQVDFLNTSKKEMSNASPKRARVDENTSNGERATNLPTTNASSGARITSTPKGTLPKISLQGDDPELTAMQEDIQQGEPTVSRTLVIEASCPRPDHPLS